jgi:transposase-like protein
MVQVVVLCRHCGSDRLVKNGHADNGKQKYRCHACGRQSREDPHRRRLSPEREAEILRAYTERSSMRGIARTFRISRNTLTALLKRGRSNSLP